MLLIVKEHKGTRSHFEKKVGEQAVPVGFREMQRGSTLFYLYGLHPYDFSIHPVKIRMKNTLNTGHIRVVFH